MSDDTSGRGRGRGRGRGSDRGRGRGGEFLLPSRGRGGASTPQGFAPDSAAQRGRGRGRGDGQGFSRGRGGPYDGPRGGPRDGPVGVQVFSQGGGPPSPDMRVLRIEKDTEDAGHLAATKTTLLGSTIDGRFPQRPGFGTRGKNTVLWTNHLHLMFHGDLLLFRYSIEISSEGGGRQPAGKKARRIVQLLLQENLRQNGFNIATDFRSTLISKIKLDLDEGGYMIHYRAEDEDDPAPNATRYRIRLLPTGSLTVSELTNYLTSTNFGTLFESKDEIIQALNIVLGHHSKASSQIASVGANRHFDLAAPEKLNLGAGLLAIRGFFVSVRAATARILVNVQVKHSAFYDDGPLDRLMLAYMSVHGPNLARLANFIKKLSVNVTHIVRRNRRGETIKRMKMITALATRDDGRGQQHPPIVPNFGAGPKEVQFFLADNSSQATGPAPGPSSVKGRKKAPKAGPVPPAQGRYINVYDYFRQAYAIDVKDTKLPVINVGTVQNPSYLPAQVCMVPPGQPANAKLTRSQVQQMIRFAVRKPPQNAQSIVTSGIQTLGIDSLNATLDAFGVNISPKLIAVPGRILSCPDVKYGGGKIASTRFGSWDMRSLQFAAKAVLPRWTYLLISSQGSHDPWRSSAELKPSLDAFRDALRGLGINTADCIPGLRISVNPDDAEAQIDAATHRFSSSANPPTLLLVILPSDDATIYNRVKYACDVKEGLLNVCVVAKKFAQANAQYLTNVALKVNLKLGGRNQYLDRSKLGMLSEGKTMVVGIDVTHPSPGSLSGAPSVAGIVASVDEWLAQWPADLRIQAARQEMVSGLDELLKSRLRLWAKHNGSYPDNILVCRDGVSEGQYDQVLDQELPALRSACKDLYPAESTRQGLPRLTIIIVGKRHNTRFYPAKEDADRSSNPQNGTVVDRGVTEARNWDFFLQAHAAIQGTARPAHYYTIFDEVFRRGKVSAPFQNTADVVEDLMHNLCYLFGRATKAVSICPPAYYADLVCDRARCYLSGVFSPTPTASPGGSVAGDSTIAGADPGLVRIHEKVRDRMFYI